MMNLIEIRNEERDWLAEIRMLGSPDGDLSPGAR